ncbi:short-chain dehydrogenase [Flavihumibacter stibioxidans]|uniref:Short-chain dehydrogenase n=1 Tax=Flavihumibacter stibioxidans TaxID=1834163 RepID=A0ABR7M5U8_9BACT|nr:short-chain dehydrogenase [Flavihumibacter stibioxidans]
MTNIQIEHFLERNNVTSKPVQIRFKNRKTLVGLFIQSRDFNDLKSKNFWRIVSETRFTDFNKSGDIQLGRIFNGMEITGLSVV